jgi:hypothetical protein
MKFQINGMQYLLLGCLVLSNPVFADIDGPKPKAHYTQLNHPEVIGALGIANLRAGNGSIGVTSSETDKLVQTNTNNWNTLAAQLGVGYVYYFHQSEHPTRKVQWFPAIEPQLNLYYLISNVGIRGDVWRFNNRAFNQLNYKIQVRSTRLMLDGVLTVVKKRRNSIYVKAGIGNAWNRLGYSDSNKANSTNPCPPDQLMHLVAKTHSNFAWELGVGALHEFNNNVGLSLEYLYTHFGTLKTSAQGSTGTITSPVITPATFNLQAQSVLLGLHFSA